MLEDFTFPFWVLIMGLTFSWQNPWPVSETQKAKTEYQGKSIIVETQQSEPAQLTEYDDRFRARDEKGRFLGDDKATPEADEAWISAPAKTPRKRVSKAKSN